VAGSRALVQMLRFEARPHVLSASIPPAVAAGCLAALRVLRREGPRLVATLQARAGRLRARLRAAGLDVPGDGTAIVPVRLPSVEQVWAVAEALLEAGVLVGAVVPPGVPRGEQRIRMTVSAAHSVEDVDRVAAAVTEAVACTARLAREVAS